MSSAAHAEQIRGAHERTAEPVQVRVIPGGLLREKPGPRHAKTRRLDGMRGIGFELTFGERVVAAAFGTLFALAALAAAIYF